ncbi:MAG: hypothetical protein ACI9SX_000188, partial [Pseudoalteromonas tetraodonis]
FRNAVRFRLRAGSLVSKRRALQAQGWLFSFETPGASGSGLAL